MEQNTNHLANEKSPYLLQHVHNPVDWYPWGEKALEKAQKEDKPIFLSIGYSTCHWCHVMAHESFEDPAVADLLNQWFVSIKVDREERPDIDQMYMAATQAMSGSGGWPMSVFLMPDGSPFYAGTYFPPRSSHNRPGFADLLQGVHNAWRERRGDLQQTAKQLVAALSEDESEASPIEAGVLDKGYALLARDFDPREGGFGQAPKFPRPVIYSFLFSYFFHTGKQEARDMALHTLRKMANGGMYDQLGGGFHRYSVDGHWFVPHFEKMLYDQAQLAHSYLDAFQISGDLFFARIAREIFTYVLRDMRDSGGGFYSAEDADSDDPYTPGRHGEGAFFLWKEEDIVKTLGAEAANHFNYCYGVEFDGNVAQDPMQEFTGRNILYRRHSADEAAEQFGLEAAVIEESLADSRKVLFEYREKRKRPHLDDKVITAWNAMMIGALAKGSRVLADADLLAAAEEAALFIQQRLYDAESGRLFRRYREGEAEHAGQLDDYAFLVSALLELHEASQSPQWLEWAEKLTLKQIELFKSDSGGFFYDSVDDPHIKIRMRGEYDGAEPAGNSIVAGNLLRLGRIRNRQEWLDMAAEVIASFGDTLNRYPPALPLMLAALQQMEEKPVQVVIAGDSAAEDTRALRQVVDSIYHPARLVLLADGGVNQNYLAGTLAFLKTVEQLDKKATAYVCRDFTCQLPVTEPEALRAELTEK